MREWTLSAVGPELTCCRLVCRHVKVEECERYVTMDGRTTYTSLRFEGLMEEKEQGEEE
jgi:hypothetical protein